MNKYTKKQNQAHKYKEQTDSGERGRGGRQAKWVKGNRRRRLLVMD